MPLAIDVVRAFTSGLASERSLASWCQINSQMAYDVRLARLAKHIIELSFFSIFSIYVGLLL